jgi:SNF2 family DNA or RNA helicase
MLLPHQQKAIEKFEGYSYLAWETGTGKTLTALKIAENFRNVLIMCPASVKQVWYQEIEKWNIKLNNFEIVSYDSFRLHYPKILKKAFWNLIIFDEAHKLKSIRAQITKLVMKVFTKTYKVMLSGTPFEKPEDYYSQLRILRPDHPFNQLSFTQYKNTFFRIDGMFYYIIDFLPGIKDKFIERYVLQYVDFVRRADIVELPSLIDDDKYFSSGRYLIEQKDKQIDGDNVLQAFMYEYRKSALLKDKIDYVIDFITDNPQTVLFSYFIEPLQHIVKKLGRKNVYFLTGQDKKDLEDALKEGEKPILATYCISEGINLTKYKNIIFLCLPLAWRAYEQALSRVWRYGQEDKVYLQRIIDKKGIDTKVWQILKRKGDVLEELKQRGSLNDG